MLNKAETIPTGRPDCFYCSRDGMLGSLMIEAAPLAVSTLYLNKDQTHKGRCIVAYNRHVTEMFQLDRTELQLFTADVSRAAKALHEAFRPDKINYAIYGDLVSHLHVHLVPKYEGGAEWGEAFINAPLSKKTLDWPLYEERIRMIREKLIEVKL